MPTMWSGVQISTKFVKIFQNFPCLLDLAKVIWDQMSQNQSTLMDKQLIHGENKMGVAYGFYYCIYVRSISLYLKRQLYKLYP